MKVKCINDTIKGRKLRLKIGTIYTASQCPVYRNNYVFAPITDQYADMTAEIAELVKETREAPDKVVPERNTHVHSLLRDILNQLL